MSGGPVVEAKRMDSHRIRSFLADAVFARRNAIEFWEKSKVALKERAIVQELEASQSKSSSTDVDNYDFKEQITNDAVKLINEFPQSPKNMASLAKQGSQRQMLVNGDRPDIGKQSLTKTPQKSSSEEEYAIQPTMNEFTRTVDADDVSHKNSDSDNGDHFAARPLELSSVPTGRQLDR
jgi:hypothetical protein